MKQYRLQPGTSSRIYYLLTVKDDGGMTLEFHGTDRTRTDEATMNADGWIVTKGAMYPPIDHPNGRWQEVDVVVADAPQNPTKSESKSEECSTFVPTTDSTDDTDNIESANNQCSQDDSEKILNEIFEDFEPTGDPVISSEQNDAPKQPKQLDLFAQMQMEVDRLRDENERLRCNMTQNARESKMERTAVCSTEPAPSPKPRRAVRAQKPTPSPYERLYGSPAITVNHTDDHSDRNRKIFAGIATLVVFVVLVNTIGLFGIAALGLLAGGLIK